jgi:hypothetical protein
MIKAVTMTKPVLLHDNGVDGKPAATTNLVPLVAMLAASDAPSANTELLLDTREDFMLATLVGWEAFFGKPVWWPIPHHTNNCE